MTKRQIDCEQALKQIFVYLDRELAAEEYSVMEHHLHTCHSCFSRAEFERRLKEQLGGLREQAASPALSWRIQALLHSFG